MSKFNSIETFCSLANGTFSSLDGMDKSKNKFKFILRGLFTLPWTLCWLDTLTSQNMVDYFVSKPRLASKLHRPYLYRSLHSRGKLTALQAHYQILKRYFSAETYNKLLSKQGLFIANLRGKNDNILRLKLTHQHDFDKEGELSLQVLNSDDVPVVTMTFTLTKHGNQTAIIIGGMQGPRPPHNNECIQESTKICYGLFPKRLAIEVLMLLAKICDCKQMIAVSKCEHVYSSLRYRRNFFADYDSFWESLNSSKTKDGRFFLLPETLPRKDIEQIASKKRAEYRRRYALLDELIAQVNSKI